MSSSKNQKVSEYINIKIKIKKVPIIVSDLE